MVALLGNIGNKIAKMLGDPEIGSQEKTKRALERDKAFSATTLAEFLPYEAFDEEHGIFINSNSIGFVIECLPLVGGDDACHKIMHNIIQEVLQEGDSLQCLLWADHRTSHFLKSWGEARQREPLYYEIAQNRIDHFQHPNSHSPRLFRFIFSYSMPIGNDLHQGMRRLSENKEKCLKSLKSLTFAFPWKAKDLLETAGGLINFSLSNEVCKRKWNPLQTLSSQIASGGKLEVEEDHLLWNNESKTLFKSYRVLDTPDHWPSFAMQRLIGDIFRDSFRIQQPFFIHYGVHCPRQDKADSSFWRRSQLIENQGKSYTLLRLIPQLADELKECDYIRRSLTQGARFVWTQMSAGFWARPGDEHQTEQALKSLFKINQFTLAENKCLHLPHFLSLLPMSWAEYVQDLKDLHVLKTTITSECPNFIPIYGEWTGTATPGMLLVGRRGQLLNWNPFDNRTGNYNCVVVGRSGSGKSVFMQELLLSGLSTGASVYVLDVGRSFEKMCDILKGQFIEFSNDSDICLNPFTNISLDDDEEREVSFTFLKSIIACMAAPTQGTTDLENSFIELAIQHAWKTKNNQATITDIAEWLQNHESQNCKNLGVMLTPFAKGGIYAKYFEGKNNVSFSNPMVLIELEELKGKNDIQAVVLQLFIMTIANRAFLGDRKTPFYICIDEAWDLLRAKQTGIFIETLARRLRKYHGSLVVGTQSVDDFFSTSGAKAAYENSDWMCLFSQKKSSISQFAENGKIKLDDHMQKALESVMTKHGEYSELMICDGDGNYSIARLVLDPFSQLLYSSQAQEFAQIKDLTSRGLPIVEAIKQILQARKVS